MAMEALSSSQFEEAMQSFTEAAAKDPKFGLAYAGMASVSGNMGRRQEAEKFAKEAIRHVDRMTERERFRTRGMFYSITNDYEPCVKEYGDLIAKYPADTAARNNRANCLGRLRDMTRAAEEMRQAVKSFRTGRCFGSTWPPTRPTWEIPQPPRRSRGR